MVELIFYTKKGKDMVDGYRKAWLQSSEGQKYLAEKKAREAAEIESKRLALNDFMDNFTKDPMSFSKEDVIKTLENLWIKADCYDGDYSFCHIPAHVGMKKESVEFRKKLALAYKQLTGESIYDIEFNGNTYFDKLVILANERRTGSNKLAQEEIAHEFLDKYITKAKRNEELINILQLNEEGEILDIPINDKIISVLEGAVNEENQQYLIYYSGEKSKAYVLYQLFNHQLKNDNMEIFQKLPNNIITKGLENRDKISDDYMKKIYQVAWFYDKGNLEPSVLRDEYKQKFSADIDDDVSQVKWPDFPLGTKRFDYLLSKGKDWEIAKHYADEFINLPLEKLNKHFGDIDCYFNDNFELKYKNDQAVLALKLKCIEKHGAENLLLKNGYGLLGYRYLHGTRNEYEISYLQKYHKESPWGEDSILEKAFNEEGKTLYTIKDLAKLARYKKTDKINIVLKDGYVVADEEQKYRLFNQLVGVTYTEIGGKREEYEPYLENLIKHNNIDIKKAEKYKDFDIGSMIDFCADISNKDNSLMYKPYIQRLVQKARSEGEKRIIDNRASELYKLGIKANFTEDLISYEKRGFSVRFPKEPKLYDFNEKFLCEASYHHSDGSHTTFLNEMLWYGRKEDTVIALNNGASPFTKAGFFRDKFEAMPFNMFFNRELKQNNEAELKDFMVYIASNINEDKKNVINDIWTSLGGKLRMDTKVQNIMRETNHILHERFPSTLEIVKKKLANQKSENKKDVILKKNNTQQLSKLQPSTNHENR